MARPRMPGVVVQEPCRVVRWPAIGPLGDDITDERVQVEGAALRSDAALDNCAAAATQPIMLGRALSRHPWR